jgi:hypothetical protein
MNIDIRCLNVGSIELNLAWNLLRDSLSSRASSISFHYTYFMPNGKLYNTRSYIYTSFHHFETILCPGNLATGIQDACLATSHKLKALGT